MTETQNIINSLTTKEKIVYGYALSECLHDYCTSALDMSDVLKMDIATVKGVIGSLTKKGFLNCEEDNRCGLKFKDVFAFSPDMDHHVSFGNENLEQEDIDKINNFLVELNQAITSSEKAEETTEEEEVVEEVVTEVVDEETIIKEIESIGTMVSNIEGEIPALQQVLDDNRYNSEDWVIVVSYLARSVSIEDNKITYSDETYDIDPPVYDEETAKNISALCRCPVGHIGRAERKCDYIDSRIRHYKDSIKSLHMRKSILLTKLVTTK